MHKHVTVTGFGHLLVSDGAVREEMRQLMRRLGTQRAAAHRLKCSEQYFSDVVSGRSKPGPKILKGLKLKRIVTYVRSAP